MTLQTSTSAAPECTLRLGLSNGGLSRALPAYDIYDRPSAKGDCENYRRDKNRLFNLFACQTMLQESHVYPANADRSTVTITSVGTSARSTTERSPWQDTNQAACGRPCGMPVTASVHSRLDHPTQNAFTHHVGSSLTGPKIAKDRREIALEFPSGTPF